MKKILIIIFCLLSIFLTCCNENSETPNEQRVYYSLAYNSDGYYVKSFDISDIKIKDTSKENVSYISATSDMLDKVYDFTKEGNYNITIKYNGYCESATISLFNEAPINDYNGYKKITDEYIDYSGANMFNRISIDDIPTLLYVGNTIGLDKSSTYGSNDTDVIKINDNNVLICLKSGKATIVDNYGNKVRISVEEENTTSDTYYSSIGYLPEMSASDIKTILHNIIDEHTVCSYSQIKTILTFTDADPNNKDNMILLYTGRSQGGEIAHNNEEDGWNREHVWPLSKLGGNTSLPAGCDAHHIRPADVSVNAIRGNLEFGYANDVVTDTYATGSTYCKVSNDYFEPRDEVKGDIARMLFYMAVRYEGDTNGEEDLELVNTESTTYQIGNLDILLIWNNNDSVDSFEENRNNVVYEYQKNRNPFIDHPSLANLIWKDEES